jgi:hypothetical protein
MKRNATIEHQVLGICWLEEEEMQNLLIKDLIWKEGWLYAVQKWEDWDEEPFLDPFHINYGCDPLGRKASRSLV